VLWVALQYGIRASELRLQLQEFVAGFLSDQARIANFGTVIVPDFQGALTLFE
jgi:hypothetical protein